MGSTYHGLSFVQATPGANVSSGGKKSRDKSTVLCHIYKELGHFRMNVLWQSLSLPQVIS